jgi:hypothetical protein
MNQRFIGAVVNVNDPEKGGRVQIRIYGMHDDNVRIPDNMLPWARCVFPVTNPVSNGVAGPTTGLVVGSTVVGYFADRYRQIPLVDGTLGATSKSSIDTSQFQTPGGQKPVPTGWKGNIEDAIQELGMTAQQAEVFITTGVDPRNLDIQTPSTPVSTPSPGDSPSAVAPSQQPDPPPPPASDFPPVDRGDDKNPVLKDNILHIGTAELKFLENKTIGAIKYSGQDIGSMLNQIGSGDIRGAISSLKDAKNAVSTLKNLVSNAPLEQINSLIQGVASDLSQMAEDQLDSVISTEVGTVVQMVESNIPGSTNQILSSVSHLIGAIGTRKSKQPISTIEDALNRISGARFTMANQMAAIDSALGKLRIKMGK